MIITLALYIALATSTADFTHTEPTKQVVVEQRHVSAYEFDLLCAIVFAEAGGEPFEGQVGVAEVILNRLDTKGYPKTIEGIIYQRNQFCGINSRTFGKTSHSVNMAVKQALREPMFQSDVVYFSNVKTATDRNFINEVILKNEVATINNHTFAREPRR